MKNYDNLLNIIITSKNEDDCRILICPERWKGTLKMKMTSKIMKTSKKDSQNNFNKWIQPQKRRQPKKMKTTFKYEKDLKK